MKRKVLQLIVGLVVLATFGFVIFAADQGKDAMKGKPVAMTGTIACTFCTLAHPDQACSKECCLTCFKSGTPPLFTDSTGSQYLLLSNEVKSPFLTPEREALVGEKVMVKGLMVKGKGVQAIYVDSVEKAGAMMEKSAGMKKAGMEKMGAMEKAADKEKAAGMEKMGDMEKAAGMEKAR